MKCPYCGRELDKILLAEWKLYEEVNRYTLSPDGTKNFECTVSVHEEESAIDAVVCPYCRNYLKWKEMDGKLIITK